METSLFNACLLGVYYAWFASANVGILTLHIKIIIDMLATILDDLKQEIKFGYLKKKHPFRYPILASVYDGRPMQRTVVLRHVTNDFQLVMYTDSRSTKIQQFMANSNASLLFYHPKKRMQIQVQGCVQIHTNDGIYQTYWQKMQGQSLNDFQTEDAPGSPIDQPTDVDYNSQNNYFCVVTLMPDSFEYLQLNRPHHTRALFSQSDGWQGRFLTP